MEELIKGVEILKTNNYYCPTIFTIMVMVIIVIVLSAISLVTYYYYELLSIFSVILSIVIPFTILIFIISGKITHPTWSRCYTTEYECYLHEDEINFKEFNDSCEIINQDGKIYTIKIKDNNKDK